MSKYRQLHNSFWESSSVESMDPIEKLLYCYLITAPASNMEGLYKQSLRRIAFETGIDADMVTQICKRLESKQLAGFKDGWVCVTQAAEHMPSTNWQLMAHAESVYEAVPEDVMEWCLSIGYQRADGSCMGHNTRLDNTRLDETRPTCGKPKSKTRHETLDVPMNQTRYDNLTTDYGKVKVDDYIERVKDWATSKNKRIADYAAAAANWLKRDSVPKLERMTDVEDETSRRLKEARSE